MAAEQHTREKLLKDMKRTKGVRFNASKRLEEEARKATRNTAYASSAVIVITLLPAFIEMPRFLVDIVSLATVALSIFMLASSLVQAAHSRLTKADQFQRCALEVNSLRRELMASDPAGDVSSYVSRYDDILRRYTINHDQVDYDKYRLEHPDEFPELAREDQVRARSNVEHAGRLADGFAASIGVTTLGLVVAAVGSSGDFREFLRVIFGLAGHLFSFAIE